VFLPLSIVQWETRKGWDVLLEAYLHEFAADEPVELHIMTKPFAKGKEVRHIIGTSAYSSLQVCSRPAVVAHQQL
jgi:hypothetical protein